MAQYSIVVEDNPSAEDVAFVARGLGEYNFSKTGAQGRWIAAFLKDAERKNLGGTHGWTFGNYLYIDLLWIQEAARGQGHGKRLLMATEQEAMKRGCRYAVLNTFDFQARGFYEKLGYRVFGELDDVVGQHRWYFLKKDLSQPMEDAHGSR
jgi:ribosomal protein S18 acetylase RimI-like enzyme